MYVQLSSFESSWSFLIKSKMADPPKVLPNTRITSKSQMENIKKVAVTRPGEQALFLELDQVNN